MSEAIVRRAVDAFMARDLDGILAEADEEIVLRSLLTEAERPLYHGHEGVRDWFENVFGVFPDWTPRPRPASHDEDGAVVIGLDVTATGAGSGAPVDQVYWLGARVQAAKIRFFGFFRTEEDALEAVARQPR
jgi:ketosteroid isomerase-like protein